MKPLSNKHLEHLQRTGKIRGFEAPGKSKTYSSDKKLPAAPKSKGLTWLEWNLQYFCNERALTLEREHKFCDDRGWRFDFAITAHKIAIEYEGGIFMQSSGHNTAKHFNKDTDKYNRATVMGWRVIRVTALNYTTVLSQLNELMK